MKEIFDLTDFIRELYHVSDGTVPLHAPKFYGREKEYLVDCINSTYVSTIGGYVDRFEKMACELSGARYAIATVNGTAALHAALVVAGVNRGDEVLTQSLTFVATANAIRYCGGEPVFLDVDRDTLGLDPEAVQVFLETETKMKNGCCYNRNSGKRIAACVPMHTFGHPCKIQLLTSLCAERNIPVVEDAAEAVGSYHGDTHCGTNGVAGVFSFNGNKIVTSGGGGMIVTNNTNFAEKVRYLTTTAKKQHPYLYEHTEVGFNYRMPNINAALACAQLEQLNTFLSDKRELASCYRQYFKNTKWQFVTEPTGCRSNYWLNAVVLPDRKFRDLFLETTNKAGIMTRPVWILLNKLEMYAHCQTDSLDNARYLEDRLVNLPSSAR